MSTNMAKTTISKTVAAIGLSLCFAATHAENTQQSRMADCNASAAGKKGDERKAFMNACLSGKPATPADTPAAKAGTPQQRMKDCNASAAGKKGDERKAFMSACLKH